MPRQTPGRTGRHLRSLGTPPGPRTVRFSSVPVRAIFSWGALSRSDPHDPLPGSESARTHSPPARRPRGLPPKETRPFHAPRPGRPRPATCPPSGRRPAGCLRLDGNQQPAVVHLTPTALERHLQGMTEKLRSGVNGKVREAIQQSVTRILVGVDGSLTIEAKPGGLLGVNGTIGQSESQEGWALIEPRTLSSGGRVWKLVTAQWVSHPAGREGSGARSAYLFPHRQSHSKPNLGPP